MPSKTVFPREQKGFVSGAETMTPAQFLECSLEVLADRGDELNPRLAQTLREVRLLLLEFSDPHPSERPLYPRFLRVAARMIEDGLL